MKILAIRGCNLASLAGEFEIDLVRAPFAEAGVFAIVGNTGAGKSTLLDALCVALFDRTPRLANHSRFVVGRGEGDPSALGVQDARTLLRRGAASGWAEVDFESGDRQRYRARWSVRRARGSPTGALQDQQMSLVALDSNEQLGGTKTETLKAIGARLGLSFDQFRRSALLAQGEFAAFLRADGKDRSELLERVTGTEIYTRLGIAAHVKAALAEQRVRDARIAASAIAVLADDARAEATREHELARAAGAAARARLGEAEAEVRWVAEDELRRRAFAQAEADHAGALAAHLAAEPDRAELALRRRAEALRPVWEAADRLDRAFALARRDVHAAELAASQAAREASTIAARGARLVAARAPIESAVRAIGGWDVGDRASVREVRGEVDALGERARALAAAATWVEARAALAAELASHRELDARFAQHALIEDQIAGFDRTLAGHDAEHARLAHTRALVSAEHQAALGKLGEAQRKAQSFQQRRGLSLDAARRQEDEARLRLAEVERLVAIAAGARQAVVARTEIDRQLVELDELDASDTTRRRELAVARTIGEAVRLERARAIDELARAAGYSHARAELVAGEPCPLCGALEHPWHGRGALDDALADARARLEDVERELATAATAAVSIAARVEQRGRERLRLAGHRATADASAADAVGIWRGHLAALGELVFETDPGTPAAEQLATDRRDVANQAVEVARDARRQAEAVAKAAADAHAEVSLQQAEVDRLAERVAQTVRATAELAATAARLRGERAARREQRDELATGLRATLVRIAAIVEHAAAIEHATALPLVEPHVTRVANAPASSALVEHAAVPKTIAAAAIDHATATPNALVEHVALDHPTAATNASALVERAANDVNGPHPRAPVTPAIDAIETRAWRDLKAAGFDLPRGRALLDELALAWRQRCEQLVVVDRELAAAVEANDRDQRACERVVVDTRARLAAAGEHRDRVIAELADASRALDGARIASGFDADALHRLLFDDDGAARVERLFEQLATLDRVVERTRAIVAERAQLVAEHRAALPSTMSCDRAIVERTRRLAVDLVACDVDTPVAERARQLAVELFACVTRVERDLDELAEQAVRAEQRVARLEATLAADRDARERRAAAESALAAIEEHAQVDRVLGAVIGSHDGKLFRSFAQSLTLDGLLAVANTHLDALAPRYQLERVPRHDLELQVVDRDLGCEVRSIQSLSGGESFLVSLALALGLSSLALALRPADATRRPGDVTLQPEADIRVRTLLIDEGFGTLDATTLDAALAVLDALQATGRQVGVISHVPSLIERVGAHVRVVQRGGGRSEVEVAPGT